MHDNCLVPQMRQMLRLLFASVLAFVAAAEETLLHSAGEVCMAEEGERSTRRTALLQVASRVGHSAVVVPQTGGPTNVDAPSNSSIDLVELADLGNTSHLPTIAVGGSAVALTDVADKDNAASTNSSIPPPLVTVATEVRTTATDKQNAAIEMQAAAADLINTSLNNKPNKNEVDEEANSATKRRNAMIASASVVLPLLFLFYCQDASYVKDDQDGEDDYWGNQRSVGVGHA